MGTKEGLTSLLCVALSEELACLIIMGQGESDEAKGYRHDINRALPDLEPEGREELSNLADRLVQEFLVLKGMQGAFDRDDQEAIDAYQEKHAWLFPRSESTLKRLFDVGDIEVCNICHRFLANQVDEERCNTGACGCKTARSLCWKKWCDDQCLPKSVHDPEYDPEEEL